ncbi:MAG TPA: MFS transporter [Candidatus Binataceae bacterium]
MAPERSKSLRAITRRYYSVSAVYSFAGGFLFGVYPIFLRARGLTQFQVNSVLAVFFVVLFLTDVPTGAFADAMGRRRSFLMGSMLRVSAFIVYFFAHHYAIFLIAESLDGVGTTFCNGAIDAWGVDSLDDAGFEGIKDRLFSRIAQLSSAGFMISAMIGAYVADINIAYPWLLGASGWAVSALVGAYLMRGEKPRAIHVAWSRMPAEIVRQVGDGMRNGFAARTVMMLSVAGAIQIAALAPYWLEWPIMFNENLRVGVWIIGWIYCGLTVARMIGAELAARMAMDESARAARICLFVGAAAVLLFVAGVFGSRPMIVLGVLFVMNLFTGALQPLIQSWFNEQIEAGQRATLLSFSSTFQTMGGAVGLLFAGRIADTAGIPFQWQTGGLILLCTIPFYLAARPRLAPAAVAASTN